MTLGQLIKKLEKLPPDLVLRCGFHRPHSYRGIYEDIALEPKDNVTVGEMLADAKGAVGSIYCGWKGGEYLMTENTRVHIAMVGCCAEHCEDCHSHDPAILIFLDNIEEDCA